VSSEINTASPRVERIIVCGGGLAGHLTTAALASQLPATIQMMWIDAPNSSDSDVFYGSVTAPTAYTFNLSAGVSEPELLLSTNTAFSWGTKYAGWGEQRRSWIQCFHLPLPIVGGVLFHHYLTRLGLGQLEPFLVSAAAARHGAFAHPLQNGPPLLARAEYAYQFDPQSYCRPFAAGANMSRVQRIQADLRGVERNESGIAALHLSDGRVQTADLYVDCTGPQALLLSQLDSTFLGGRRLRALSSQRAVDRLGPAYRTLTGHGFGWQSETPLQQSTMRLTVLAPECESDALSAHGESPQRSAEATLGCQTQAWVGNCVAIGHAAHVMEPITHAPMLLLHRDIERLLSLIPFSTSMAFESREFNRQSTDDYLHAAIFNRTMFETPPLADTPYWRAAREEPVHEKLEQKLAQFENRGLLVTFDLEPFNPEDWLVLHYGMQRRPARHDRVADRVPESELRQSLAKMPSDIEKLVKQMPTHHDYMAGLLSYLAQQKS
jgi:tryptophan halogenase